MKRASVFARVRTELGVNASVGTPAGALRFGDIVLLSAPWDAIPEALQQAGSLAGKIVIDDVRR